jgi:hypothetical protein
VKGTLQTALLFHITQVHKKFKFANEFWEKRDVCDGVQNVIEDSDKATGMKKRLIIRGTFHVTLRVRG